jgi:hypothetical protein
MSRRANKPTIRRADKPMSQRADCLAPQSCRLHRHRTPFVLCWGEGSSSSYQHSLKRVLRSANEPTSQQANNKQADKPTSQRADCSATLSHQLCRHRTPFVPCWGERTLFSSQHALRRVLCLAEEDGYIPGWVRKMVVIVVVVAVPGHIAQHSRHSLQHSVLHSMLHSALHSALHIVLHSTLHSKTKRAQEGNRPSCACYQSWSVLLVFLGVDCLEK